MNWTGGRLSRHSRNAKGSLTQRQKQYFAKVRNNSLNGGQKGSPIKWSLFEQDQTVPQRNLPDPSAAASISSNQASNQPGRSLYDNTRRRVRQRDETLPIAPAPAATQQKHPSPRQVRLLHNEYDLNHRPFDSPHEETLMPPQSSKRRRHASSVQFENAVLTHMPGEEESLEDRRRKILSKSDWVGADIQRPLKLKYTSLTTDGKIGKRRRIDLDENMFGAILQPVVSSPFEASKRKSMTQDAKLTYPYRDEIQSGWIPESRNHVRISIGGKHKPVGVTSSTSHRLTQRDQFISSQDSISDVMLLDGEDTSRRYNRHSRGREGQYSDPLLPPLLDSKAIRVRNPQTKISHRSAPRYGKWTPGRQKRFSSKVHSEVKVSLSTARTSARNRLRLGEPQVTKQDHCLPESSNYETSSGEMHHENGRRLEVSTLPHFTLAKLRSLGVQRFEDITNLQHPVGGETGHHKTHDRPPSPQEDCITSMSRHLSNSARKLQSVAWDKARNLSHFSSGPQLLHPIPQSSRKPPVLRTTSPEDATSVIAQLGAGKPVVPPSQLLDEEVWKTWVLSSDMKDSEDEFRQHGVDEVLLSPGISTIAHPLDQDSLLQHTAAKENTLASTHEGDHENQFGDETGLDEGKHDIEKTSSVDMIQGKREIQLPGEEALTTLPVPDYKRTFLLRSKPIWSPPKVVLQPNPEEAWMKFILSDNVDYEEDGPAITAPRPQKALIKLPTLSPPESSLLAQPSTEATLGTHPNSSHFNIHSSPPAPVATVGSTATPVHNTRVSNHSTRGSNTSSSSDPISRSLSHISKRHFLFSSEVGPQPNLPTTRRILFNKPPRFTTRGYGRSYSPDELAGGKDDVLHIGQKRKALVKGAQKSAGKCRNGHRLKDIYGLSSSDDDVESIEDI